MQVILRIQVPLEITLGKSEILHEVAKRIKMNAAFRPAHGAVDITVKALCFSLACGCTGFDVRILAH